MLYFALILASLADAAARSWIGPALPDLVFLTALYLGFRSKSTDALYAAVLAGALQDGFSHWPLGHFAFLFGLGAVVARSLRRFVPSDSAGVFAVVVTLCSLVGAFAELALTVLSGRPELGSGFGPALLRALFAGVLAPFIYQFWVSTGLLRSVTGPRRFEFAG